MLHICYACFNHGIVIGAAILAEKKLKDIYRYISPFLYFLCQVFANNLTVKVLAESFFNDLTGAFSTL